MNISAENNAMASDNNGKLALLNPRTWSIKWKVRLNFLLKAAVAIGLIILMVNFLQRRNAIHEANDKLLLLTNTKSSYVEDYFTHVNQQLNSFSTDRQTLEAFNQLGSAFLTIENDNYFTSTVASYDRVKTLLEGFYNTEILPVLDGASNNSTNLQTLLPADNKQHILQYLYLASNSKPMGAKSTINKSDDGSAYSFMHAQYHPEILKFARQTGISDILFVDYKSGYVIYSLRKNLDFATNLFEGPYKNSGLGMAFKNAAGQSAMGSVTYTDASLYVPALFQPNFFMSAPVFSGSQLVGVVVFAVSVSALDKLLLYEKEGISSGKSLKTIVIGNDFLYRSNDPEFISEPAKYIRKLKKNADNGETAADAARYGSTALVQAVDPLTFADALKGKENLARYSSETGERVLCSYAPLKIGNLNWIILTQMDKSDALASVHRLLLIMIVIALLVAILLYYISIITSNSIAHRLHKLKDGIISLSKGEKIQEIDDDSNDDIGQAIMAVGKLNKRINETATFVTEMGKGNIDLDFSVTGDEDFYGISMNSLKKSLMIQREEEEKRKDEAEIRNWSTHGIAIFNDILRMDNNNLEKLAFNITQNIIQYLSANQGGLFLIEEEEGTKYLNLVASYAYDRQKFLKKKIAIGEGLAGTCVLEKKTILLNKIPDNYLAITSGLGGSKPGCLLIVPLKKEEDVLGVLEVASFNDFKPHEVEFVEKVAESIASALITVRLHLQTSEYLERFQQQAEEMKSQDEELRQSIEELQATHETMERLKQEESERNEKMIKDMDDFRKLLISVLNEVPEKIFLKDDKGRFIIANKLVADNYNRPVEEILGKSDFDFYAKDEATEYFKHEQEIIKSGTAQSFEEGDPSRYDGQIVRSIKKPFFIEHLGITGLFGVQFDISDIKRKEFEAIKLVEEIKEKQKEIETASVELQKEQALLDALLSNVPECIYFKDKQSKFIRFSKSMLELFGLEKPEDLLGKSDFDFFSDEHARPAYEGEQEIIETGKAIIDLEEKEVMEDGRVSWVNTTKMPLRNSQGEIIGTFGISKNISRLKKLEFEAMQKADKLIANEVYMEKNRKLLINILDKVPAKIFLKDENGVFLIVNSSVAAVYNKTVDQVIGTSDYDNHPDEDVDGWRIQELEIMEKGEKTYMHSETTGEVTRFLKTIKMPFHIATTDKTGLLGTQFDVTEMKLLEEKLEAVNREIEELRKKG